MPFLPVSVLLLMLHWLSQEISFIICYYWHTSAGFSLFGTSPGFCYFRKCFSRNSWGMKVASDCIFSCVLIHSLSSFLWFCWVALSKAGIQFQTTSMGDEEYRGKERGGSYRKNNGSFEIWEWAQRARIGRRQIDNYNLTWTAPIHGKSNGHCSPSPLCYTNTCPSPSSFCICI